METRYLLRCALAALALLFALNACAGEEPQGVRIPLSGTGSGGSVYALRGARFRIAGPHTITLDGDETAGDVLSAGVPVGDYTVTLLEGWTLVRLPDGTPMIATLASANPVSVSVTTGMRARVTFVFDVMGEMVAMTGDGDIDIGFEVNDDAGSCGTEVCNGADDDCDGTIDEGLGAMMLFADADADGFGDPSAPNALCAPEPGFVPDASDCDDTRATINPAAAESCSNMLDDDCDGAVDEGCGCMPAAEVCNGVDDDCDGAVDEDCGCVPAAEVCNGVDDDCDMIVDEGVSSTFFRDADADGFGDTMASVEACSPPAGFTATSGDCDDFNFTRHPGAVESCNGQDDDCDGAVDEGC